MVCPICYGNDADKCIECIKSSNPQFYLFSHTCSQTCRTKTYADNASFLCSFCDFNCKDCKDSASNCLTCMKSYYYDENDSNKCNKECKLKTTFADDVKNECSKCV